MKTNKRPLYLSLHCFDDRCIKTMQQFLQGPCHGAAVIVADDLTADVLVFDADIPASKKMLENYLVTEINKAVLVLSLYEFNHKDTLYLKKPASLDVMLKVLEQAKKVCEKFEKIAGAKPVPPPISQVETASKPSENGEKTETNTLSSAEEYLKQLDDWFKFD